MIANGAFAVLEQGWNKNTTLSPRVGDPTLYPGVTPRGHPSEASGHPPAASTRTTKRPLVGRWCSRGA
jgi:hypothetical protein